MFRFAVWLLPLVVVAQPSKRGGISAITLPDQTFGRVIALDKSGDIYVAGIAFAGFPTTTGAFQPEYRSGACPNGRYGTRDCEDIFVARLSRDGAIKAATYLGGTGAEEVTALAVDSAGNVHLTGSTSSRDFPVLGRNAQPKLQGAGDAFYVRMQSDLTRISFSTYLGGSSTDRATSVALASDGSVVVYGETWSDDLPMPDSALQKSAQPRDPQRYSASDLFLARIQPQPDEKVAYSTYLGGPDGVQAGTVAMDGGGNLYITGTVGPKFPTTPGSLSSHENGGALVAKISPDGSKLLYSSVLGGNRFTRGVSLAVDQNGRATVAAYTNSTDMPVTADAIQRSGGGPGDLHTNAYVARLNARGDALEYATYYGYPGFQTVRGMIMEPSGALLIVGENLWKAPAVTANAVQSCGFANVGWGFVARIQPGSSGNSGLLYASLLRGSGQDSAYAVAAGPDGRAYITGFTNSDDFTNLAPTVNSFHEGAARTFVVIVDDVQQTIPHVGCLAHAADMLPTAIVPGEIVSLFGANLGPQSPARFQIDSDGRVATTLVGVRVLFDGVPAPLLYVSATQINAVVPAAIRGNTRVSVQVEWGAAASESFSVPVTNLSPALFTLDGTGTGGVAAINQNGTVNTKANPARRGDIITVFGTGALWPGGARDGALNPLAADPLPLPFQVLGLSQSGPAEVLFAGPAPGQVAGMFQLNIRIPLDAWRGDAVPIALGFRDAPAGHYQTIAITE